MAEDVDMTPEERALLHDTHEKTSRLYRAFFEPPEGGGETLIKRMVFVVETLERGGWAGKWALRIIVGGGGLAAALVNWKLFGGLVK